MNYTEKTGFEFEILKDKLSYKKEDYMPAVEWTKSFADGKYAYQNPESELETLYFGARYMERTQDQDLLKEHDFMADATVINPGKVGDEFVKTVGHYHGLIPGTTLSYPEVYEAVTDGFEYLLQSETKEDNSVDVIWVKTQAGDKVIMPPNWGHVSMNVGTAVALEVDLQKRDNPNQSDYSVFKDNVGGALYRTAEGLIENTHYKINSLRIVTPKEVPDWGLTTDKPLYSSAIEGPEKFRFLTHPDEFDWDLDKFFEDIEL